MPPDEASSIRVDIAELRGLITGQLQGIVQTQQRHEEELRGHKLEFDQIHQRQNKLDSTVAAHGADIVNLKTKDGRKPAYGSLLVAALALIVTLGGAIQWQ